MQEILALWVKDPLAVKAGLAVLFVAVIVIVARLTIRGLAHRVPDAGMRYRVRKLVVLVGYLAALLIIASLFSVRWSELALALGVAGAGIAFALQEVIASVAGWLAVSFGGFYRPGDRIQLGGIRGDVIDIGVLRTTLMEIGQWINGDSYNGRIVRVANSFVFKEPVFNYSADFPFLWDEIMVPIKYGSDYHQARSILERVGEEVVGEYARSAEQQWERMTTRYLIETASVRPMVSMAANSNWLEFTMRYVVDYKQRRITKDKLFTRVLEEIDLTHDKVGIAASTLNIEKLPPLDIRFATPVPVSPREG